MNAFNIVVSFTALLLLVLSPEVDAWHKHKHIKLYKGYKFLKKAKFVPIILPVPIKHGGYKKGGYGGYGGHW